MDRALDRLRTDSLSLFEAAREAEQYEVAYHALAAALHAAEAQGALGVCYTVQRLANECREVVDANGTRHKLSSESAALRDRPLRGEEGERDVGVARRAQGGQQRAQGHAHRHGVAGLPDHQLEIASHVASIMRAC